MSSTDSSSDPVAEFDEFADDYDAALDRGLALTGEDKNYFAEGRTRWLAKCLGRLEHPAESCLDFGCGTGTAAPFIFENLGVKTLVGIDPSSESISVAAEEQSRDGATFENSESFDRKGEFDLAYCNGVFHHIVPDQRPAAVRQVFAALKSGGYFSLWENNAWNLITRFLMSRVPFDRDAILLWPRGARRMLEDAGFEIVQTDFAFIFPGPLKCLRFLEEPLRKLPLGGQYQILARKP